MSITDRKKEEEKKHRPKGSKPNGANSTGNFISFNPTKDQKQAIRQSGLTLADNLDYLSTWLTLGHKLSWIYNREQEAWAVFIRDGSADWREALVLSCWHVDYELAIAMMAYALNNVYTSFPAVEIGKSQRDIDW